MNENPKLNTLNKSNNFKNSETLFFIVYSKIKDYQLNPKLKNNEKNDALESIYKSLESLKKILSKKKNNKLLIQGIYDKYYHQIIQINFFLIGLQTVESRSLHDIIFTKIFGMNQKHIPVGLTIVFEEFIKGITYFKYEQEFKKKIPIYHRAASCGDSSNNFKKKYLQCYHNNTYNNREEKKKHIFKCYLERLIYDNMYKKLTLHFPSNINNLEINQDEGHIYQLTQRAKNFNSCYLGMNIDIEIDYEDNFPYLLTIYFIKNGEIIKTETYKKYTYLDDYMNRQYSDFVEVNINENNMYYKLFQNFSGEQFIP